MSTKITPFRLSDNTLANLDEAIALMRELHKRDGTEWMVSGISRTDVVRKAIDYYLSHLIQRKRAAKEEAKPRKERRMQHDLETVRRGA